MLSTNGNKEINNFKQGLINAIGFWIVNDALNQVLRPLAITL